MVHNFDLIIEPLHLKYDYLTDVVRNLFLFNKVYFNVSKISKNKLSLKNIVLLIIALTYKLFLPQARTPVHHKLLMIDLV